MKTTVAEELTGVIFVFIPPFNLMGDVYLSSPCIRSFSSPGRF